MLLTAAVTTRPPARLVAVIAAAASISDMIQPPNMSPLGLVSAGIARVRAARSRGGGFCLLTAASGSGQPTLLRLITLAARPTHGTLTLFGADTAALARNARAA